MGCFRDVVCLPFKVSTTSKLLLVSCSCRTELCWEHWFSAASIAMQVVVQPTSTVTLSLLLLLLLVADLHRFL
jgi:hypothetical protein